MGRIKDLTGMKFGRLTVLRQIGLSIDRRSIDWLCACECGNEKVVRSKYLLKGSIKSCGCMKHENHNRYNHFKKHGLWKHRLYRIWALMKARCNNPNRKEYPNYGGRGIKVCKEWSEDFLKFYNWAINNEYKDTLTLERSNNDGDYEPSNCKWATKIEQARNTRRNHKILFNGIEKTIAEWAEDLNVNPDAIYTRIKRGWNIEECLFGREKTV